MDREMEVEREVFLETAGAKYIETDDRLCVRFRDPQTCVVIELPESACTPENVLMALNSVRERAKQLQAELTPESLHGAILSLLKSRGGMTCRQIEEEFRDRPDRYSIPRALDWLHERLFVFRPGKKRLWTARA